MALHDLVDVIEEVAPDLELKFEDEHAHFRVARGRAARPTVRRVSLTPSAANRLVTDAGEPGLVVVDVTHSAAEETLRLAGWSYWDRRGRLRLWLPEIGVRLDVPTRSYVTGADGPDPRRPVVGVGGISLALGLLLEPNDPPGVREIARMADMAPSTISRSRRHLTSAALIDTDGTPLVPELFWATSDAWVVEPVPVEAEPDGEGWVLGGDAAAVVWGAPALAGAKRYYCADRSTFDRHRIRHGSDDDSPIQVAMAPSPLVVATAVDDIAHPVVAALDLSTSARGREILTDWHELESSAPDGAAVVWQ